VSQPPVIIFQAPNGIGLGHVNRLVAIALAVRSREPAAIVPFVLLGGGDSLLEKPSLPYVTLPYGPLMLSKQGYSPWGTAVLSEVSRAIIQGWAADLIVFDTVPCAPFMRAAAKMKVPMALCARKTRDNTPTDSNWLLEHQSMFELLIIARTGRSGRPGAAGFPRAFRRQYRPAPCT
jgi:hypothetical protein